MPRGGAREGAGRHEKPIEEKASTISIKAAPRLQGRLRAVAEHLGKTHAEVLEMGVDRAERLAAKTGYVVKPVSVTKSGTRAAKRGAK